MKLREDLYTIGLLRRSPYVWIFDIRTGTGEWKDVNLNHVRTLCCVAIVQSVMKNMVVGKIDPKNVVPPDYLPVPSYWIKPLNWMDLTANPTRTTVSGGNNFPWHGGKLIALDPDIGSIDSPVVKHILDLNTDREVIESCELTNMWSDQDLTDRLCRYFDTGVNRDDLKFEIFPGLWSDREKLRPLTRRLPIPYR
jgi:hypothetical protein